MGSTSSRLAVAAIVSLLEGIVSRAGWVVGDFPSPTPETSRAYYVTDDPEPGKGSLGSTYRAGGSWAVEAFSPDDGGLSIMVGASDSLEEARALMLAEALLRSWVPSLAGWKVGTNGAAVVVRRRLGGAVDLYEVVADVGVSGSGFSVLGLGPEVWEPSRASALLELLLRVERAAGVGEPAVVVERAEVDLELLERARREVEESLP